MSKTLTTVDNIPDKVIGFAEAWAMMFVDGNKNWRTRDFFEDTWHYFEGFDLNLLCEGGRLTICAYPSNQDDNGSITTNYSDFTVIFTKG